MGLSPAARSAAKTERQAKVAAFRLAGNHNQSAIARALGEAQTTVHRDFKDLDKRFREQADADTRTMKGIQKERLEAMIRGLWQDATHGRWLAVDRVLGCLEREAKLFGLDAPKEVSGTLTLTLREAAEKVAARDGLDLAAVLAEAEAIVRELGAG